MNQAARAEISGPDWTSLYRVGGVAALIAGILFRRNLGVEIALFSAQKQPGQVVDWFALLQTNRLLGLAYLNVFDIVNYVLLGLMFLALVVVLWRVHPVQVAIAALLGWMGIVVYLTTNTALSMLSLSEQYAIATTEVQRSALQAAGQALLAINRFSSSGAQPGAGGYLSLLLIAAASLLISIAMLRSAAFNRVTAIVGILASALDLAYCLAFIFVPTAGAGPLAVFFIPAAGLFWMVWHILIGIRLYRLGQYGEKTVAEPSLRG